MSADDTTETVEDRVRPSILVDVPTGMVLRPRDDEGRRVVFRPDQEYKCFTTSEWSDVGHLVTDYRWLWYYAIQMELKAELLGKDIAKLELHISILQDSVDVTQRGLDSMAALLDKEHAARLQTTRKAAVELWAWRIGTVLGLVAAGAFGAAARIRSRPR